MQQARRFFVHPSALCESSDVGDETRVWAFAHVMSGARLGCQCNVGDHAFVETGAVLGDRVTVKNNVMIWEGVTIEDDVFLGPGVIFTNDRFPRSPRMAGVDTLKIKYSDKANWLAATRVCKGASIGAGAIILCGLTIGSYSLVAAGAVVRKSVPAHALVAGNPARTIGWVCRCAFKFKTAGRRKILRCPDCECAYKVVEGQLVPLEEGHV